MVALFQSHYGGIRVQYLRLVRRLPVSVSFRGALTDRRHPGVTAPLRVRLQQMRSTNETPAPLAAVLATP